ncbi:toll/interleukin-1 receptor domain-containing protein [Amycolatopsis sp. OK19-0408]|uniref:Toll/interleukin-1 receptor domain-containing protein n=1 Tax=Amycolatopsis iheyensis TaxID=2945988 RepID=A0A9X2SML7_9PSEU|nr:toll/interleukin-1 receptor domain-containing protein [Amycolatopsis iheyensis]MCR6487764.1 toll/interleukin-1 receptor domain-containing protein [Amycolatopsis iheyensis]
MVEPFNVYSPVDVPAGELPALPRVFVSHRNLDKPLAEAVTAVLDRLGVHYWFDRDDVDSQAAAALGMVGDQQLVHAIERGVRHCTHLLGLLSAATAGSWWVPYEIGFSRSARIPVSYLVLPSIRSMAGLPEYVRLGANFWSADELVRWAGGLAEGRRGGVDGAVADGLTGFVPRLPPAPAVAELAARAVAAIGLLATPAVQATLALTRTDRFQWLPSAGGLVRDLAYDLLAPPAFHDVAAGTISAREEALLRSVAAAPTWHRVLAQAAPALSYAPDVEGWRYERYRNPPVHWLQGLTPGQLQERLHRFFVVDDLDGRSRLATREEFKEEFDRVLRDGVTGDERSLGVLLNPLFGFTPADRPVYWRVLAVQYELYHRILGTTAPPGVFDEPTSALARRVADRG